ncbi:hypothetical protein M3E13_13260 [Oceanobacillus kimchii]|uniref:hypothetical protein n=1 Tax=Oceanobacillus kimchii TaxID=746691 RepID=UPI0021A3A270|nr:hypothetical protein [Oceanobacillus kimchii]MCT1577882.1 hypothetical protein [Oceanobacillus kimchii]MCT2136870.1 hypothetical protein [Oceanobacillus kimchii]
MLIKIQNKHLKDAAEFLQNTISAKGKENLHRMRVVKSFNEKYESIAEEEITLLKEYANTDTNGELIKNESGGIEISDPYGFNKQHRELFDEYYILDDKNLESASQTVERLVNDFDKELSGKEAELHFILVESFVSNDQ